MEQLGLANAKILIVDDLTVDQRLLSNILRRHSFVPITASTGRDGIELACREQPDAILLDVRMPEMDGYEVLRRLKSSAETKDLPVLLISAEYCDDDRIALGLDLGAHDYVTKPVNPEVLVARVRAAVRIRRAEQSLREAQSRLVKAEQLRAVLDLSRSIAHELAQPLAISTGIVDLMLTVGGLDETTRERLEEVHAGNLRMASTLERLRSITSYQTRELFPGFTGLDLEASAS